MKPKPRSATTFLTVPVVTLTPFTSRTGWQAHGLFEKQVDRREAPSHSTTTTQGYARSPNAATCSPGRPPPPQDPPPPRAAAAGRGPSLARGQPRDVLDRAGPPTEGAAIR